MSDFGPAPVSVYPGPDAGFVDPWSSGSVCGECSEPVVGQACSCCGQWADPSSDVLHGFVLGDGENARLIAIPSTEQAR